LFEVYAAVFPAVRSRRVSEAHNVRNTELANTATADQSEINLTPMLDVVFIMLIFFLVVAAFIREAGLDLDRPSAPPRPVAEDQSILILIEDDNEIRIGARSIDPRALRGEIERLRAANPDYRLVIRADRRSANKTLVQVMDASRQAGVYNIALAGDDE
jgi:biopolymer transport protein ExbD